MSKDYLIDSNILITAHRQLYPFDIMPGFWNQMITKAAGKIIIIEAVNDEILAGEDKLTAWFLENKKKFNVLTIPEQIVIDSYKKIISKINIDQQYTPLAKDDFASVADSWLCAYGLAYDCKLVTLEKFDENIKKRIPIPNICKCFNISCIDLLQFMREVGFRL